MKVSVNILYSFVNNIKIFNELSKTPRADAKGVLTLLAFLFGFLANSPNLFIRAGIAAIWISNSSRR